MLPFVLTVVICRSSWPFTYENISDNIRKLQGLVMSRESVSENMGTGHLNLEDSTEARIL